ncbi:hypothetical protein ACI6QG_02080 [Roseococcus sp. DSY-14]|uniref:hypothetical protein n=1 Tax=Roseococcus sp. DSY-14 TaxID=3369650 RepID=UPI00387B4470
MQRIGLVLVFSGLALVLGAVGFLFAQGSSIGAAPALMVTVAGLLLASGMACLERGQQAAILARA